MTLCCVWSTLWLNAPIDEREDDGKRRIFGGKNKARQPAGCSPLLANIYVNRFLRHWCPNGCGEAFGARVVSYANNLVTWGEGGDGQAGANPQCS
jgi:RNA-directed DNA polymerase